MWMRMRFRRLGRRRRQAAVAGRGLVGNILGAGSWGKLVVCQDLGGARSADIQYMNATVRAAWRGHSTDAKYNTHQEGSPNASYLYSVLY